MNKGFLELLEKAKGLNVIDEGSLVIFKDYINQCELQIQKNVDMMNRIAGKNDQLRFTAACLGDVVRKYIRLQEDANLAANDKIEVMLREEYAEERPKEVSGSHEEVPEGVNTDKVTKKQKETKKKPLKKVVTEEV